MKKLAVVVAAVLAVGGAVWLAGTWMVGKETEKLVHTQIDAANQQAAMQGVKQELVSYERSLTGAKAVTRLVVTNPALAPWLNNTQFTHDIKHGPVLFGKGVHLGVSYWQSHLDLASLSPEAKNFVDKAFAGKEPIVADTTIGFDKVIHSELVLNPIDAKIDESSSTIKLAGALLTADISATEKSGPFSFKADSFELRSPNTTVTLPSIEMQGKAGKVIGGLENVTAKIPQLAILAAGSTQPIKMDVALEASSIEQNGSLQGRTTFNVANIQGQTPTGEAVPVKQFDMKVDYAGFKLDGLKEIQALNAKLESLQERMAVDEAATELPEGQKQQMELAQQAQQISEELLAVVMNKVLEAGKSNLRYDMALTLDKGTIKGITDLTYAGATKPIELNDVLTFGPKDWGRLVTGSLNINADKAAVPADVSMMLAYPLEQKTILDEGGKYQLALKLLGESAELNGSKVEFADLPAKFFPQMPSLSETNDLGLPPDLMKQIEEQGITPEIMQQLEESDDVPKETVEMLKQLQQMNGKAPQ